MYSNVLWVLRHYLSNAVGDLLYGNAGTTGATTTKIYAPFLWQADDYYNELKYEAYVYLGTNIGVTKRVTDWVLSTFLATVHSAYDNACDATSYVEFHRIFSEDDYRKAINLAIESLDDFLIDKIDISTTLIADHYEYTLPVGMDYVHKVTTEETSGEGNFYDIKEIDPRDWSLISPRTLKLRKGYYSITAGKDLRIEGQGRQSILTSDTDVCKLPPDWLVQKAITFLPQNKIQSNELDATYRQAIVLSSGEPKAHPNPRGRKVAE